MINSRGVAVDIDLVRGALDVGARVKRDFTAEAVAVSGIRNPNSVKQLAEWLNAEMDDEEIKDLRKGTVSRLLAKEGNSAEVQRMLEIRQELSKTSTKSMMRLKRVSAVTDACAGFSNSTVRTVQDAGLDDWCRCRTCREPTRRRLRWHESW